MVDDLGQLQSAAIDEPKNFNKIDLLKSWIGPITRADDTFSVCLW
jgi:hypothetical protein